MIEVGNDLWELKEKSWVQKENTTEKLISVVKKAEAPNRGS
jgi:hypothetical protein